ncbi:unnamed protein product [Rhizoctonia solani]|uniref:Uncharacterized protein n=1 Tax=Rhizoctonia solani TaxID=456999 RepID=A0A8H3HJE1_9AGAM|nr:unnamed protein product [Rhizoctonia solani]
MPYTHTQDMEYYKGRAIRIRSKELSGVLPGTQDLLSFLKNFGIILDLRVFCLKNGVQNVEPPNNAIVIFKSRAPVPQLLNSSQNETDECFWRTYSTTARPIFWSKETTGAVSRLFSEMVDKLVGLRSKVWPLDSGYTSLPDNSQLHTDKSQIPALTRPNSGDIGPPAKRSRTECRTGDGAVDSATYLVTTPNSSRTSSDTPESPEWMRRQISRLEAELDTARAACDLAISEQDVIRKAYQAEQNARREATAQKSAAEAAVSRKEVEQGRLRAELEAALFQKSALMDDVELLHGRLTATEERLKIVQSSSNESARSDERFSSLKLELEEAQDRAHKLQLQKSRLEAQQGIKSETTELDDARAKIKQLKSEVKRFKSDFASIQGRLESTQKSLETKERKCSSTRRRYESTKVKLGIYKARLENEQILMQKLKDTLTPEAYRSLGATHETLGAFLSAIGLPPANKEGSPGPKEESD